jgi:hypothetical protein
LKKVTSFDCVFVTCSFIITSSVSARQWKYMAECLSYHLHYCM